MDKKYKLKENEKPLERIDVLIHTGGLGEDWNIKRIDTLPENANANITLAKSVFADSYTGVNLAEKYTKLQLTKSKILLTSVICKYDIPADLSDEAKKGDDGNKNGGETQTLNAEDGTSSSYTASTEALSIGETSNEDGISSGYTSPNDAHTWKDPVLLPDMSRSKIQDYVWNTLTTLSMVDFPIPCKNHNPNLKKIMDAITIFGYFDIYQSANVIRVDVDKSMEDFRVQVIMDDKQLVYHTRNLVQPVFLTMKAQAEFGRWNTNRALTGALYNDITIFDPTSVDAIDIFAVSSIAVDYSGRRIGMHQTICSLEFFILQELGLINSKTTIVTFVSEEQIFQNIPDGEFKDFEFSVDFIITPARIITVDKPHRRPSFNSSLHINDDEKAFVTKILQYYNYKKAKGKPDCQSGN